VSALAVLLHPRRASRLLREYEADLMLLVEAIVRTSGRQPGPAPRHLRAVD
jgi:hypothetical protein